MGGDHADQGDAGTHEPETGAQGQVTERHKTPSTRLRAAPMATTQGLASVQHTILRNSRQAGTLAVPHARDRRQVRHRRSLLFPLPKVAAIPKPSHLCNNNTFHDTP